MCSSNTWNGRTSVLQELGEILQAHYYFGQVHWSSITNPVLWKTGGEKNKKQRAQTSEVNEINTYMSWLNVCARLTPAQWCALVMVGQGPSSQQWHHRDGYWTHWKTVTDTRFQSVILLRCANWKIHPILTPYFLSVFLEFWGVILWVSASFFVCLVVYYYYFYFATFTCLQFDFPTKTESEKQVLTEAL